MAWARVITQGLALLAVILRTAAERRKSAATRAELRRQRELGRAEAIGETIEDVLGLIRRARNARMRVRDRLRADPDRLREDDGFRRR